MDKLNAYSVTWSKFPDETAIVFAGSRTAALNSAVAAAYDAWACVRWVDFRVTRNPNIDYLSESGDIRKNRPYTLEFIDGLIERVAKMGAGNE